MKDVQTHSTQMELSEPAPPELPIGSDLNLRVTVSCRSGCDLRAMPLMVSGPDGQTATIAPSPDRDPASEDDTRHITLTAPLAVGTHAWTIRFPSHERDGILHGECTLPVGVTTRPHATSLAVWAVPSPVVMRERFRIKVGAKSAAGCGLGGTKILVSDGGGRLIAQGSLQDTPWPGTSALYWTEVEVPAPNREGMFWCTVNFAAADIDIPHERSASKFSVAIVRPPEHRLTIEVLERDSKTPIEDAQVRLGAYRAATDPTGRAEVAMPKGTYDLAVWKVGYEAPVQTVDVHDDVSVQVEAVIVPPENPDAAWLM
jgi:hypothetical protein